MPVYTIGRWQVTVADDGTVEVADNGVIKETVDATTFETRGESRPSYVPANQMTTFAPIIRRVLHLIDDRRRGPRSG